MAVLPGVRRIIRYVTSHYFLTNAGYFGVLSTLVVSPTAAGFSAPQTGVLVMIFTITRMVAKKCG